MAEIEFFKLEKAHLDELVEWHRDELIASRYGNIFWPESMLGLCERRENRFCLVASLENKNVGYIDFEINENDFEGWIGLVVNPIMRGSGYGTRILKQFTTTPVARKARELRAGIELDNLASIKCFENAGFEKISPEPDEEGCFVFAYKFS